MSKHILSALFIIALAVAGLFSQADVRNKLASLVATSPQAEVAAAPAAPAAPGGALEQIIEKGVVRVGVQSPSKPFYFVENGSPKGFNAEFLKVLFAQSEFTGASKSIVIDTERTVDTYAELPQLLLKTDNRGKAVVDIVIDGLTFDDSDLAGVVYTIPYIKDFGYSLIAGKNSTIQSVADTAGKRIGVLKGDPDAKAFAEKTFAGSSIVELSDSAVNGDRKWIADAITSKAVDAVVYDYPFGVSEIEGTTMQFVIPKLAGSDLQYKIGVRKSDKQLLTALNTAIRKAVDSPEYVTLLKKYFVSNKVASAKAASSTESVYVVKTGDTLSTIASTLLGNKMRYTEIESRNNIANPNLISVGQKLVIPK